MTVSQLPIAHQWSLHSMQLVNWGCFDGHLRVEFAGPRQVTLITGSTGSGKSTLLDAHIVLMHNPSTALNRASNTTSHRSRSGETRNIVSYMRGVQGQTRDVDGERDVVLREGTVWSSIAETWRSTDGSVLTAISAFFSTQADTIRPQVRRDAWIAAEFDLRWLEPFATGQHLASPFPKRVMEKSYPGLQVVDSTVAQHRALWERLGIGDEDAGKNAMSLLYKVQAADAVQSVNDLFTKFVLDVPCTYARAEDAERHFQTLRESWDRVRVIDDQTARLSRIPDLWAQYEAGRDEVTLFTELNPSLEPSRSPFWKWRWDRESTALEEAEQAASREYRQADSDFVAAQRAADEREKEFQSIVATIGKNSALSELDGLEERIRSSEQTLGRVEKAHHDLKSKVGVVLTVPTDRAGYDRQRTASSAFQSSFEARRKAAEATWDGAKRDHWGLESQLNNLREDRRHFEGRQDVTDRDHDHIRNRYATLVGLEPHQLPFAGELMDMLPEHEAWRMAAEKVLGSTATSLLVPESSLVQFRRVANDELTAYRVPYLVVRNLDVAVLKGDPTTIAGRLQYRDHPYSGWLSKRVSRSAGHLCVDSPDQLGDLPAPYREAVTVQGQTATRDGGVVGGQMRHRPTIGFTPELALARIDDQIRAVRERLVPVVQAVEAAKRKLDGLVAQERAHSEFLDTDWDDIDVVGVTSARDTLLRRKEVLASDPSAARLIAERNEASTAFAAASALAVTREARKGDLQRAWADLSSRKDDAWDRLTELEDVPDLHTDRIDAMLADFRDDPDVPAPVASDFDPVAWRKFVKHLNDRYQTADGKRDNARLALTSTFDDYLREYRDSPGVEDLTSDPDRSYWQFHSILVRHRASGVEHAKTDFTKYAADYGGHELTTLSLAYQTERDNIDARLSEIRGALADQPYGPTPTGRVSIIARDGHTPAAVTQFRKDLHAATAGATSVLTYEEAVAKFERFDQLISQLSDAKQRDLLLDVRQHVVLEAQHLDGENLVSIHRDLGTKSGGETQELTMFIIAAAIRYKVGSLDEKTPRFAPVFMDEGLIKADPERTKRAVDVWTHLGFQPVIATTTDKHESISRSATVMLSVSKDPTNRSCIDAIIEATDDQFDPTAEASG